MSFPSVGVGALSVERVVRRSPCPDHPDESLEEGDSLISMSPSMSIEPSVGSVGVHPLTGFGLAQTSTVSPLERFSVTGTSSPTCCQSAGASIIIGRGSYRAELPTLPPAGTQATRHLLRMTSLFPRSKFVHLHQCPRRGRWPATRPRIPSCSPSQHRRDVGRRLWDPGIGHGHRGIGARRSTRWWCSPSHWHSPRGPRRRPASPPSTCACHFGCYCDCLLDEPLQIVGHVPGAGSRTWK